MIVQPGAGELTIYVYFRTPASLRESVLAAIARQFSLVESRCGVDCGCSLRVDPDKPYLTWLETYRRIGAGELSTVSAAIDEAANASGLAALAAEGRHREIFEAIPAG